jgi:hypothetical protein
VQFQKLEEKRLDLVDAEMLFDLPLTDYSSFIKCRADMESLEQIYKLFKQQKVGIGLYYLLVLKLFFKCNNLLILVFYCFNKTFFFG